MREITTTLLAMLILSFAYTAAYAEPELSGTPNELQRYLDRNDQLIAIYGYAEETAYSDTAHITLAVVTKEKTLSQALQANANLRQTLVDDLVQAGIAREDINNAQFSTSPQYGWFGKTPSQFEVANRVKVTARSEQELNIVSKSADERDEITVSSIEFEHSQREQVRLQVTLDALANAKAKAAAYGEAVGLSLQPITFNPGEQAYQGRNQSRIEEVVVTAQRYAPSVAASGPVAPVSFEELKYSTTAVVTFKVVAE